MQMEFRHKCSGGDGADDFHGVVVSRVSGGRDLTGMGFQRGCDFSLRTVLPRKSVSFDMMMMRIWCAEPVNAQRVANAGDLEGMSVWTVAMSPFHQ